jgi:glycosyltransferase involved in cell wall biosynthesis
MTSVAIAHDYLTQRGGAERVVLALLRAFPDATIYTTLYDPDSTYPEFRDAHIVTSPLNRVGLLRRHHRAALPLLPLAAWSLRIREDVVIMSTSGWAHGFNATGRRVVYCHAPARWLYQLDTYLGGPAWKSLLGMPMLALRPLLTLWDQRQARRASLYLVNSRVVQERTRKAYGIDSVLVPAPHAVTTSGRQTEPSELTDWADLGYHLVVSRLLPYKNVGAVIEAFAGLPDERLVIVGRGPEGTQLLSAAGPNVRMLQDLSDEEIRWVYAHATTLIAPSIEDYGLTPLEAGAYGKPTLALRGGGYLDTIANGVNGAFFDRPTAVEIRTAVVANLWRTWDTDAIRDHVAAFGEDPFIDRLRALVNQPDHPSRRPEGRGAATGQAQH